MRLPSISAPVAVAISLLVVSIFLSLGGAGLAANGGAFVLGVVNAATARTYLGASFGGSAMQVANTSTAASATALSLSVAAGHAPMMVNSTTRVTNLNADLLDGVDGAGYTRAIRVNYSLASGEATAPITVPAGVPVLLVGVNHVPTAGVGEVSLHRIAGSEILWQGLSETNHVYGGSAIPGTAIIYIDHAHSVIVEVASPDTIKIHDASGLAASGSVTLMW